MTDISDLVICIGHLTRPKRRVCKPLHGDCQHCTPDPLRNPYCSGYTPIKVRTFLVLEQVTLELEREREEYVNETPHTD